MIGREAERIAVTRDNSNNSNVVVIRLKDHVSRLDIRITCDKLFDYIVITKYKYHSRLCWL